MAVPTRVAPTCTWTKEWVEGLTKDQLLEVLRSNGGNDHMMLAILNPVSHAYWFPDPHKTYRDS